MRVHQMDDCVYLFLVPALKTIDFLIFSSVACTIFQRVEEDVFVSCEMVENVSPIEILSSSLLTVIKRAVKQTNKQNKTKIK